MKKIGLIIGVVAVLGAGAWAAWHQREASKAQAETMAASTAEVTLDDVESVVTAQGKLEPKDYVDVGAQVSGMIESMPVEIGDEVKQGQLIAEIDPDVYRSRVEGDEARLKTLQAQKAEQEALVAQAQQKFDRNRQLLSENAIAREVFEDAQTALKTARSRVASIAAQIEEANSTLEGDRANLSYTKIYATMSGTVVSQPVKEGQTINANQTAPVIVQIANLDVMTVRAQVAEADIIKLTPEMNVYFTTLGSGERRWNGRVRQILPSPETVNDVVLYNVLVDVDNKDHQLMTGMTTQMFFILGQAKNMPVLPASALMKRMPEKDTAEGQAYIVKIQGAGKTPPEERVVIVALSDRSQAAIAQGLKPGDRVMLNTPKAAPAGEGAAQGSARGMRGMPRL